MYKKPVKHRARKNEYMWNPCTCACEIDNYLKSYAYMKSLINASLVTCDETTHPTARRRGDFVMTPVCISQQRRRYVSNETPYDVSMERRQVASVVRLHDVLLECRGDLSRGRNNDVSSERLHDVLNKS